MSSKPKSSTSRPSTARSAKPKNNSNGVKRKRTDFSKLKKGDRLSETQYYSVLSIDDETMRVKNERGFEFSVSREIVEEGMFNATQYTEIKKLSRTAIVNILESTGGAIFTVNFDMKPTDDSVLGVLKTFTIADFSDQSRLAHLSKKVAHGENRTLTGYMISTEAKMGRSKVIDLAKAAPVNIRAAPVNIRSVDHRTLNWLIFKDVKYVTK